MAASQLLYGHKAAPSPLLFHDALVPCPSLHHHSTLMCLHTYVSHHYHSRELIQCNKTIGGYDPIDV